MPTYRVGLLRSLAFVSFATVTAGGWSVGCGADTEDGAADSTPDSAVSDASSGSPTDAGDPSPSDGATDASTPTPDATPHQDADTDADTVTDADADADAAPPGPNAAETQAPSSVYAGQEIVVTCLVRDPDGTTYEAPAGATPTITFSPADAVVTDQGKYTATKAGTVTVTCSFPSLGIADDSPATVEIQPPTVPEITCAADATMINAAAASSLNVTGTVQDVNGIIGLTVNGAPVTVANGGTFAQSVTTRFGINFVDIAATNGLGRKKNKTCTFLAANQWADPAALYTDTLSLRLSQAAIDDGARSGARTSFADFAYAVVNSSALTSSVNAGLAAANPLKAKGCDSQTCAPVVGCVCNYMSGVDYITNGVSLPGPNLMDLTLVNGGIQAHARVPGVVVPLRVDSAAGPVPTTKSDGTVTYAYVDVTLTYDVKMANGAPRVTVRPNTTTTAVGAISTSFPSVDGWTIDNVLIPLAKGTVKNVVSTKVQDYLANNVTFVLDTLVSGLDVSTVGTTYNVPKLDSSGSILVTFALGRSMLNVTPSRALFGLSTRFSAPAANGFSSLGVPVPTGTVSNDPTVSAPSTVANSTHIGVFEQALHALWRANFYATTLDSAKIGGSVPPGVTVKIDAKLPPVVNLASSTQTELSLGSTSVEIVYPGLFDGEAPFKGAFGARGTSSANLAGNDLQFGGITVTELELDSDVELAPATRTTLEDLMKQVFSKIATASLDASLPALPIATFPMSASFAQYGLPSNGQLGIVGPSLGLDPRHYVLRGAFGLR